MHFIRTTTRAVALLSLSAVSNAAPGLQNGIGLAPRSILLQHPRPHAAFLRIEGLDSTVYDGNVLFPYGRNITTALGGTHKCDGTNGGAYPTPGPTCTSIIAQAAGHGNGKVEHAYPSFTFDGTWSDQFQDFFITRIGTSDSNNGGNMFWGVLLEWQFTPAGGCQSRANPASHTLWAFNAFNKNYFLKMTAPGGAEATAGQPFTLNVIDGMGSGLVSDAVVNAYDPNTGMAVPNGDSVQVDGSGNVVFTKSEPGKYYYKAYEQNSIRSNAIEIIVKKVEPIV